jgi:hypothetical protein
MRALICSSDLWQANSGRHAGEGPSPPLPAEGGTWCCMEFIGNIHPVGIQTNPVKVACQVRNEPGQAS